MVRTIEIFKKYKNKIVLFIAIAIFLYIYIESALNVRAQLAALYDDACIKLENGDYQDAIDIFTELDDYKDSLEYIEIAKQHLNNNLYENRNDILLDKSSKEDDIKLKQLKYSNTISAGIRYTAAICNNGKVKFYGEDVDLKKEVENWSDIVSISVCGHLVIGLKNDGTVIHAGTISNQEINTNNWNNIISISAGQQYIVGLKSDGTLVSQGHNGDHQRDIEDLNNYNNVLLATGWRHTVTLDENGEIHITGYKSESQFNEIKQNKDDWINIIAISAGGGADNGEGAKEAHTVALKKDKTVVAVGSNNHGQCNVSKEDGWENIVAISAGGFHTVGLKENGRVITTQTGDSADEISKWENIVAISAGDGFTLGLTSDGKVVHAGYDKQGQNDIDGLENVIVRDEWEYISDK